LRSLPITKEDEAAFERGYARGKGLTVDDFDLLKVVGKGSFGKVNTSYPFLKMYHRPLKCVWRLVAVALVGLV
jgi:hypothetical protein